MKLIKNPFLKNGCVKEGTVMLSEKNLMKEALIIAVYAEIQGMEVANIQRKSKGKDFAYDEKAFLNAAKELRKIATE